MFEGLKRETNRDKFLQNKIIFLNDMGYKESTCENLYRMFKNYIHDFELSYNKDLMSFKRSELENIIVSLATFSIRTKANVISLIRGYVGYWIDRGAINNNINFVELINRELMEEVNEVRLKSKYISLDDTYRIVYKALSSSDVNEMDCLIVIMARYGLSYKEIISIEKEDIKNGYINVRKDTRVVKRIKIDNRFMNLLSEASSLKEFTSGNKVYKYERSNKVARYIEDRPFRYGALRKCIYKVMSSQDKDITLADLNKSYIYDRVLEIYNRKGFLIANDFKEVVKANIIGSGSSTYSPYVKEFLKMFPNVEYRSK